MSRKIMIAKSSDTSGPSPIRCATTAEAHPVLSDADEILDLKSAARLLGYSQSHLSKILAGKFPESPKASPRPRRPHGSDPAGRCLGVVLSGREEQSGFMRQC